MPILWIWVKCDDCGYKILVKSDQEIRQEYLHWKKDFVLVKVHKDKEFKRLQKMWENVCDGDFKYKIKRDDCVLKLIGRSHFEAHCMAILFDGKPDLDTNRPG